MKTLQTLHIDNTSWDVLCFADHVKNTVVAKDLSESWSHERLPVYFEEANFGDIEDPATILDQHGHVMVWALQGVLHPNRLVRWNFLHHRPVDHSFAA